MISITDSALPSKLYEVLVACKPLIMGNLLNWGQKFCKSHASQMIHQLNLLFRKYLKSNPSNKYTELEGTKEKLYTGILIIMKLVALYAIKKNSFDFNSIDLKHMK